MLNRCNRFHPARQNLPQPMIFNSDGHLVPFVPVEHHQIYTDFSLQNCQKFGLSLTSLSSPIARPFDAIDKTLEMAASVLENNIVVSQN